jgi:hypothetical protein
MYPLPFPHPANAAATTAINIATRTLLIESSRQKCAYRTRQITVEFLAVCDGRMNLVWPVVTGSRG